MPPSCARDGSCISRRVPDEGPSRLGRSTAMRLPDSVRHAWGVAAKDLLVEFRSRTGILSAAVFVVLVLMVFNFGRDPTAIPNILLAHSNLWVTFPFSATIAFTPAFQLDLENQALDGQLLAPIGRSSIHL